MQNISIEMAATAGLRIVDTIIKTENNNPHGINPKQIPKK